MLAGAACVVRGAYRVPGRYRSDASVHVFDILWYGRAYGRGARARGCAPSVARSLMHRSAAVLRPIAMFAMLVLTAALTLCQLTAAAPTAYACRRLHLVSLPLCAHVYMDSNTTGACCMPHPRASPLALPAVLSALTNSWDGVQTQGQGRRPSGMDRSDAFRLVLWICVRWRGEEAACKACAATYSSNPQLCMQSQTGWHALLHSPLAHR